MNFIKSIFSETSDTSCMRVMSVLSLVIAAIIAFYGLRQKLDLTGIATLSGIFVAAAFGGKLGQKAMENK